ncbi:MAG: HEAT repeat domain-containing protein [Planctomycetes bacterium]|nr:HEAT repeat domain-containing protein [Planctomycetota bacterium]
MPDAGRRTQDGEAPPLLVMFSQFLLIPLLLVAVACGLYAGLRWMLLRPQPVERAFRDLSSSNPRAQWEAAWRLMEGGEKDERMVDPLVAILRQSAPAGPVPSWDRMLMDFLKPEGTARWDDVRLYAALLLGRSGSPRARGPLEEAALSSEPVLRVFALAGLVEGGWSESFDAFARAASDEEPMVRLLVAHGLGRLDDPRAPDVLRPLLTDPHQEVTWNAALALAHHGGSAAIPVVRRLLDPDFLDAVRVRDADGTEIPLSAPVRESLVVGAVHASARLKAKELLPDLRRLGTRSPPSIQVLVRGAEEAIGK